MPNGWWKSGAAGLIKEKGKETTGGQNDGWWYFFLAAAPDSGEEGRRGRQVHVGGLRGATSVGRAADTRCNSFVYSTVGVDCSTVVKAKVPLQRSLADGHGRSVWCLASVFFFC